MPTHLHYRFTDCDNPTSDAYTGHTSIVEKWLLRISKICLGSVDGIPSTSIHEMFEFGLLEVISFRCFQSVWIIFRYFNKVEIVFRFTFLDLSVNVRFQAFVFGPVRWGI